MRRGPFLTATLSLVFAIVSGRMVNASETLAVEAAGLTTVVASGSAHVRLSIPSETTLSEKDISLDLVEGDYAFAGFARERAVCRPPTGIANVCMDWQVYVVGDDPGLASFPGLFNPRVIAPDPGNVLPGLFDIYLVSNGRVELTLVFPGLSGSSRISAEQDSNSHIESLPRMCLSIPNCEAAGYGGVEHNVGERGFSSVFAYSWIPSQQILPGVSRLGSAAVDVCQYPSPVSAPNEPADPSKHPTGCDLAPSTTAPFEGPSRASFFGLHAASGYVAHGMISWNDRASGLNYNGYVAEKTSPLASGGRYAAFGVWLSIPLAAVG